MYNPLLMIDFYKATHAEQYPKDMTMIYHLMSKLIYASILKEIYNKTLQRYYNGCNYIDTHIEESFHHG